MRSEIDKKKKLNNSIIVDQIPFEFDRDEIISKAGIRVGTEDETDFDILIKRIKEVAKPKALYKIAFVESIDANEVQVDDVVFVSEIMSKRLSTVKRVFPFVVTCGREVDMLCYDGDMLEKYRLDILRESLLMEAYNSVKTNLEQRYEISSLSSMCPGSGKRELWPIEQQKELFQLLGDTHGSVGVELTESCLMVPNKSLSGIFFPAEIDFHSCSLCHREDCYDRRDVFDQDLWDSAHS